MILVSSILSPDTNTFCSPIYVAPFSMNFPTIMSNIIIITRCAGLASKLSLDFALMHKERVKAGEINRMILVIINIVLMIVMKMVMLI